MAKEFLTDVKTLRARARKHIEKGAVTEGYRADRDTVIRILNEALATEIVCVLRRRHADLQINPNPSRRRTMTLGDCMCGTKLSHGYR